jgi:hypothetical protein
VLNPKWRQWQWMSSIKCEEINFVFGWLQENGFEWLKRVSEGKKNFVIPKLRNAVAFNPYVVWGIWTPIFHNTWGIWTGITNICREFDLTKTSKSKFPGVCPRGGCQGFDLIRALFSRGTLSVVTVLETKTITTTNKSPKQYA